MKKSVIKEIFEGTCGNYNHVKLSQEYEGAKNKMAAAVDAFLSKLTLEQQNEFHEAYEFIGDSESEFAQDHFVEGFKLGLLIGIEVGG